MAKREQSKTFVYQGQTVTINRKLVGGYSVPEHGGTNARLREVPSASCFSVRCGDLRDSALTMANAKKHGRTLARLQNKKEGNK